MPIIEEYPSGTLSITPARLSSICRRNHGWVADFSHRSFRSARTGARSGVPQRRIRTGRRHSAQHRERSTIMERWLAITLALILALAAFVTPALASPTALYVKDQTAEALFDNTNGCINTTVFVVASKN